MAKRNLSEPCYVGEVQPDGIDNDALETGLVNRESLGHVVSGTVKSNVLLDDVWPEETSGNEFGGVF